MLQPKAEVVVGVVESHLLSRFATGGSPGRDGISRQNGNTGAVVAGCGVEESGATPSGQTSLTVGETGDITGGIACIERGVSLFTISVQTERKK